MTSEPAPDRSHTTTDTHEQDAYLMALYHSGGPQPFDPENEPAQRAVALGFSSVWFHNYDGEQRIWLTLAGMARVEYSVSHGLARFTTPSTATAPSTEPPFGEERHLDFTLRHYQTCKHYDMVSVGSGHSDAAHMCDAIAADIRREHTVNGRVTKKGEALADAVKRAGDAIWHMREKLQ